MTRNSVMAGVVLTALLLTPHMAAAQAAPAGTPVHVVVGKPLTPMTDVLAGIAKQTGVPILADDTVVDTVGVTTIDKPGVEEMLKALSALGQGLSWQRVDLPSDAPLPDANALSNQVRALKALTATRLTVTDPTARTTVNYTRAAMDTAKTHDTPDRVVYLVTNETVRAQRLAAQKAAEVKKQVAENTTPTSSVVGGMQTAADNFGNMTPDQQRQALPQMFQQMLRLFQNLDPGIREEMRQRFQGGMPGMGGGLPGQGGGGTPGR